MTVNTQSINETFQDEKARQHHLVEKWSKVLDTEGQGIQPINEDTRKKVTAYLLDNQAKYLNESANSVQGMATWTPILMSMVRRAAPRLIAYDVMGVQAMDAPNSYIFSLTAKYNDKGTYPNDPANTEALFKKIDTTYSGTGTEKAADDGAGTPNSWGSYASASTGTGMETAVGEVAPWAEMGISIEKANVEAKTRQLKATYSQELAEDMKRIHGLSADSELLTILSNEIIAETNREVMQTIYKAAKVGAQSATTAGVVDLDADADGRWSVEKFKGLRYMIMKDANEIAYDTRRGKGNKLITSANVATALEMSGLLDFNPALQAQTNLNIDAAGMTYAGRMGTIDVYIDPYAQGDGYAIGYKGDQYDAGIYYCPYIPLQLSRAVNSDVFHNTMGFKTRYGIAANPFSTLTADSNAYYRKARVINL